MPWLIRHTGKKRFLQLEQYNVLTGIATGEYKDNDLGDPDYIAPFDSPSCPNFDEHFETTTTTTIEVTTTTTIL